MVFYVLGGVTEASLRPGDFVAIAGRKTFVPGAQFVALAYRRLGVESPGQGMGYFFIIMCLCFGVFGLLFTYQGALSEANGRYVFIPMLALGAFGVYRLIEIRNAARQLSLLEMPLTTRSSGR